MAVSSRYILHQGPVIGALARGAYAALQQQRKGTPEGTMQTPGPEYRTVVSPRPTDSVRDYVRHVGGEPSAYKGRLPPHLFPQWVFPLMTRTLEGAPYPMARVMNGGCRMVVNAELPIDEPLHVRAHLEDIDDNGRRAVLHQKGVTSTSAHPEALVSDFYAIVPLGGGKDEKKDGGGKKKKKKDKPRVPDDVREVAFWRIGDKAGLEFAKLTGDFNPVHWVPPYARAMGFKNVILHGFSTMARAIEGLNRGLFSGDTRAIRVFDARFTRPLVLPARVGLYIRDTDDGHEAYVGDAPGGPAYLVASYEYQH